MLVFELSREHGGQWSVVAYVRCQKEAREWVRHPGQQSQRVRLASHEIWMVE